MDTSQELVPLEDLVSRSEIERTDRERTWLYRSVGGQSEEGVIRVLDALQYGPDRQVSLRNRDSSVKQQIDGRCSTYATIGAMENDLGGRVELSAIALWSDYAQYSLELAIKAASENAIPTNSGDGRYKITVFRYLATDFHQVIQAIDEQNACVVAMQTPRQLYMREAQVEETSGMLHGGHALCVSGYKIESGRPYFLVKNSWGPTCGDHGYQWVSFRLFQLRGYAYFWRLSRVSQVAP